MPKKPPATLADVAEKAGVSIATASRLLKGDTGFREETIASVHRAVKELHYSPQRRHKPKGTAHISSKPETNVAAICLYHPEEAGHTSFTDGTAHLFQRLGNTRGMEVQIHRWILGEMPLPGIRDLIGDAEGVLIRIPNRLQEDGWIRDWLEDLPAVQFLGFNRHHRLFCDHVTPDHDVLGSKLACYFAEKRVKHIIYAGAFQPHTLHPDLCRSFFQTGRELGLETSLYVAGSPGKDADLTARFGWLAQPCRRLDDFNLMMQAIYRDSSVPFGLFIPTFTGIAMGTTSLMAMGMRIHKDVYPVGQVSSVQAIDPLDPMPAMMHLQHEELAQRALHQLAYRIQHPERPYARLLVAPEMIRPEEMSSFLARHRTSV